MKPLPTNPAPDNPTPENPTPSDSGLGSPGRGAYRVTVAGAGVIGLSSAIRLAEAGYQVDVLARELPLETTSAVAGGLWMPFLAEPAAAVARWSRLTLEVLLGLATTVDAGVAVRTGYLLTEPPDPTEPPEPPAWAAGLEQLDLLSVADPVPGHRHGWQLRVPLVDTGSYLPYLVRRLALAGGTLTRLPLTALPSRGIVVNCTGLAARALANDQQVRPIRGQVVWTTNPGLTTWWSDDSDPDLLTYVLPHARHVVVGGTADQDDWSTTPNQQTAELILQRARVLVPALRTATVLGHRVGLRPSRPTVRLETVIGTEGSVVHCYGHGGSGLTLSWGCADDVLREVDQITGSDQDPEH